MTRELSRESVGEQYIQFRGFQSNVSIDAVGLSFRTATRETPDDHPNMTEHVAVPVATREAIRTGESPPNAVPEEVAHAITEGDLSNPLINYGVACEFVGEDGEVCSSVFENPNGLNGHLASHYSSAAEEADEPLSEVGMEESPTEKAESGEGNETTTETEGESEDGGESEEAAMEEDSTADTTDTTDTTEAEDDRTMTQENESDDENAVEGIEQSNVSGMTEAEANAVENAEGGEDSEGGEDDGGEGE